MDCTINVRRFDLMFVQCMQDPQKNNSDVWSNLALHFLVISEAKMGWWNQKAALLAVPLAAILLIASIGWRIQHEELLESYGQVGEDSQLADLIDSPLMYAKVTSPSILPTGLSHQCNHCITAFRKRSTICSRWTHQEKLICQILRKK